MSASLDLVQARWRVGLFGPSEVREVASELLDAGVSSDALIELFALTDEVAVWRGPGLLEKALTELCGEMTEEEAARVLATDIASRVLSGRLQPAEATALAARIHIETGYRFDEFHKLYVLDEEMSYLDGYGLSYLGRTSASVAQDVENEARRILAAEPEQAQGA